jgi:hypothetical protein
MTYSWSSSGSSPTMRPHRIGIARFPAQANAVWAEVDIAPAKARSWAANRSRARSRNSAPAAVSLTKRGVRSTSRAANRVFLDQSRGFRSRRLVFRQRRNAIRAEVSYSLSKATLGQIFSKIASRDPLKTTTEENKAIMEGAIAYYGTYSVSEPDKSLTLRVEASSFPNQVGADRKRTITELTGDQ